MATTKTATDAYTYTYVPAKIFRGRMLRRSPDSEGSSALVCPSLPQSILVYPSLP